MGCRLVYNLPQPTSFIFQIAAAYTDRQSIKRENFQIRPEQELSALQFGLMGNRAHRFVAPAGELVVDYNATVELLGEAGGGIYPDEVPHSQLPTDVLPFLNPSRCCESDKLQRYAWAEFGAISSGLHRCQMIVDWVHRHLDYVPGSSWPGTTACDVLLERSGVCRDYAHLCIGFCRALGIPARYVAGYAVDLEPPDFHGVFEVYLGEDWYLFDASKLALVTGFVRIGSGRDATDTSFATYAGAAVIMQSMSVWAREISPAEGSDPGAN